MSDRTRPTVQKARNWAQRAAGRAGESDTPCPWAHGAISDKCYYAWIPGAKLYDQYADFMMRSTFCLCPLGWASWYWLGCTMLVCIFSHDGEPHKNLILLVPRKTMGGGMGTLLAQCPESIISQLACPQDTAHRRERHSWMYPSHHRRRHTIAVRLGYRLADIFSEGTTSWLTFELRRDTRFLVFLP